MLGLFEGIVFYREVFNRALLQLLLDESIKRKGEEVGDTFSLFFYAKSVKNVKRET